MPKLEFFESKTNKNGEHKTHVYELDGLTIPSVTRVLKDTGLYSLSPFSTGAARGLIVHLILEQLDNNVVDVEFIPQDILPYVEQYQKFKKESGFKVNKTEQRICHEQLLVAGTLDRIGSLNDKEYVLEIKTGVLAPAAHIQVAAYWGILGDSSLKCAILHLKNYKYNLYVLKTKEILQSWNLFQAALSVWKFRNENNLLGD